MARTRIPASVPLRLDGFRDNPEKRAAYAENFRAFREVSGQDKLCTFQEYWTLVLNNSNEFEDVRSSLGISASQFHGVNEDETVIEACRREFPGTNLYTGDWCAVLDEHPICPDGGIVYLDTYHEFDRKRPLASTMCAQTINRVGPRTLVCVNVCAENRRSPNIPITEDVFNTHFKDSIEDPHLLRELGRYEYKSRETRMVCRFFWKTTGTRIVTSDSYRGTWTPETAKKTLGKKKLHDWQVEFAEGIASNPKTRITAPTGSGKTTMMLAAAVYAMRKGMRVLFVVPQKQIASGFLKPNLVAGDGRKLVPKDHQFIGLPTAYQTKESLGERLFRWVTQSTRAECAITSTTTLVSIIDSLEKSGCSLDNLLILQDEAHHMSGVMSRDDDCTEEEAARYEREGTLLGTFYEHLFETRKAWVSLVSATQFRGDGVPMLSEKAAKEFVPFEYPFWEHWKYLELETLNFDFVGYERSRSIETLIEAIVSEPEEHHIVCVPAVGRRFRADGAWFERLKERLEKAMAEREIPGIVLDLVSPSEQEKSKLILDDDSTRYSEDLSYEGAIRVVLSCNIMREGTDWVPATRIHDLAPSASLNRTIQTLGRLLRKHPKKRTIAYYVYYRNLHRKATEKDVQNLATDHANVTWATLYLGEAFFGNPESFPEGGKHPVLPNLERFFGEKKFEVLRGLYAALELQKGKGREGEEAIDFALHTLDIRPHLRPGVESNLEVLELLRTILVRRVHAEQVGRERSAIDPRLRYGASFPDALPSSMLREKEGFNHTVEGTLFSTFSTAITSEGHEEIGKALKKIAVPIQNSEKRDLEAIAITKETRKKARPKHKSRSARLLREGKYEGHRSVTGASEHRRDDDADPVCDTGFSSKRKK